MAVCITTLASPRLPTGVERHRLRRIVQRLPPRIAPRPAAPAEPERPEAVPGDMGTLGPGARDGPSGETVSWHRRIKAEVQPRCGAPPQEAGRPKRAFR